MGWRRPVTLDVAPAPAEASRVGGAGRPVLCVTARVLLVAPHHRLCSLELYHHRRQKLIDPDPQAAAHSDEESRSQKQSILIFSLSLFPFLRQRSCATYTSAFELLRVLLLVLH